MKILKNIPKKFKSDRKGLDFFFSGDYISNGVFAIHKRYLSVGFLAEVTCSAEIYGYQPNISGCIPSKEKILDYNTCTFSNFIFEDDGFKKRLLYNNSYFLTINDDLASLFNIKYDEILIYDRESPVIILNKDDQEIDLILMPMQFNANEIIDIAKTMREIGV